MELPNKIIEILIDNLWINCTHKTTPDFLHMYNFFGGEGGCENMRFSSGGVSSYVKNFRLDPIENASFLGTPYLYNHIRSCMEPCLPLQFTMLPCRCILKLVMKDYNGFIGDFRT